MAGGMGRPVSLRNKNMFKKPIRFKRQIQNTDLYRHQRAYALSRAKNKCEVCGKLQGEPNLAGKPIKQLDMHHIEDFDNIISKYNIKTVAQARLCPPLWDVNNAQILCPDCHKLTDSYGKGKK